MKITYEQSKSCRGQSLGTIIRRLIIAWLLAASVEYLLLPASLRDLAGLDGLAAMNPLRMILVVGAALAALWLLNLKMGERWLMAGAAVLLMVPGLLASFTWAYLTICLLILAVVLCYALRGWKGDPVPTLKREYENRGCRWLVIGGAVAFFLLVSIWTVCRVWSFNTPSFDFSIFAQMFHSMKTTGLPVTTIERDGPLSHFAVHVSPIYYLMLPAYWLVPRPETLQVLQAAVLASGVIPLWKLGKHHGLNPMPRALLCLVLLLYPAYAGGTSYDIHENAFLTPLILWLFYGMDRKCSWLTILAAALTLMVKEDAAVYVAVVALYLILRSGLRKDRRGLVTGCGMLLGAVVYFAAVTGYLASSGDGVMTYRYRNFMYDGSDSLVTVIKAVLLCPMKAVFECVDAEKLKFIALTLLPLAGLPFITRRYERYVLLIPYVLVNLMSDYQYQHDIFFQYTYGSTACLMYMTLVNLADIRLEKRRVGAALAAVCIGAGCFGGQILPKAVRYPSMCVTYADYYDTLRKNLDMIPEGVSVAATTYFTTYLSQRDTLYDVRYASKEHLLECAYVAVNPGDEKSLKQYGGFEAFEKMLLDEGYELVVSQTQKLRIYQKK